MATQLVTWTALPHGVTPDKQRLRLAAYVSPRLQLAPGETQQLVHFPDFLHWPDVVQGMSFVVQVAGGMDITATVTNTGSTALDNGLWQYLFNENTFVRSHDFQDYSTTPVQSYGVRNVLNVLRQNYQLLGVAAPSRIPVLNDIAGERSRGTNDPLLNVLAPQAIRSLPR